MDFEPDSPIKIGFISLRNELEWILNLILLSKLDFGLIVNARVVIDIMFPIRLKQEMYK